MNFSENKGFIFNIQKFSIHDGEGIRTLVFMKGCPLRCLWCCNPESQSFKKDLLFIRSKCIGCGYCVKRCPKGAISPKTFNINRALCDKCGECAKVCYAESKQLVGKWITRSEIMDELEKDRIAFNNSGGGLTLGGGEPICQPEFVTALLKDAQQLSIRTAMESCGYGEWGKIKGIYPHLDQLFMDLKHMDSEAHKKLTGVGNEIILENAKKIASIGTDITFRIPLIPGCNDTEKNVRNTAEFVRKLGDRVRLEILPYHRLGEDKFKWMDREYALEGIEVQAKDIKEKMYEIIRNCGCSVVV